MKTIKEMKQEIKDKYDGTPERQIGVGIYLDKIGSKYVHILNCHQGCKYNQKIEIKEFYEKNIGQFLGLC